MRAIIIGTGSICGCHVHAIKERGALIAAICDIDRQKAERFASEHGLDCPVYTDWKKMVDEVGADVVHICTPHYLHAEMAVYALNKNVNVFTEKPLCISFEQLDEVLTAAESSRASIGVCFQNRYLPCNRMAAEMLREREIYAVHGNVLWNRDERYYASGDWRGKWATEGGGALINQAIHTLDLMITCAGVPKSVTAKMENDHLKDVIEVEDKADLVMDCGDFKMTLYATTAAEKSYPIAIEYLTNKGVLKVTADCVYDNGELVSSNKNGKAVGKVEWGYGHDTVISEFYDHVESGAQFNTLATDVVDTMKTVFYAYKSAKSGITENIE